ncbi:MAG: hypothetical protein PVI33_03640 [Candidatus Omnitrophota bacterium]|jgi:hypothetical protein
MRDATVLSLFLLVFLLLSGCFVVINDGSKTQVIGSRKEHALDTYEKIKETKPEDKLEFQIGQTKPKQ